MSQLMESVMEAAALQLASPISVELWSLVAGFHGYSGSVQPQRFVEEFDCTRLSPRMFCFCKYKSYVSYWCCLTVTTLLSASEAMNVMELWSIDRLTGFNVGSSYHVVYWLCNRRACLRSLWVVPSVVYGQRASLQFEFIRHVGAHGNYFRPGHPPFIPRPSTRDRMKRKRSRILFYATHARLNCYKLLYHAMRQESRKSREIYWNPEILAEIWKPQVKSWNLRDLPKSSMKSRHFEISHVSLGVSDPSS